MIYMVAWELPVQFEAANKLANGHVGLAVYVSPAVRTAASCIRQSAAGRRDEANSSGSHANPLF